MTFDIKIGPIINAVATIEGEVVCLNVRDFTIGIHGSSKVNLYSVLYAKTRTFNTVHQWQSSIQEPARSYLFIMNHMHARTEPTRAQFLCSIRMTINDCVRLCQSRDDVSRETTQFCLAR